MTVIAPTPKFTSRHIMALAVAATPFHPGSMEQGVDKLLLNGMGTLWLKAVMEAGAHPCPTCLNLWSTAVRMEECDHSGGSGAAKPLPDKSVARTIARWVEDARREMGE